MRRSLLRAARCIAAPLAGAWLLASGCFAQNVQPADPIHIYVQARTLEGDPIEGLTSKDFKVSASGQSVPVSSVRSSSSQGVSPSLDDAHVLLMISVYSDYAAEAAITGLLVKNFPESFGNIRMAVCQRNGRITDYVGSRAELIEQIRSFRFRREHFVQAIGELGQFPGRRSLIYLTEKGVNIPPPLRRKAEQVAALTYQVDGDRWQNYVADGDTPPVTEYLYSVPRSHGGGVASTVPVASTSLVRSIREVRVVRTLKDAYKDLNNDGRGYYDLTVDLPQDVLALDLRLDLKYDYQLTAQDSSTGNSVPPELHLPSRQ